MSWQQRFSCGAVKATRCGGYSCKTGSARQGVLVGRGGDVVASSHGQRRARKGQVRVAEEADDPLVAVPAQLIDQGCSFYIDFIDQRG